MVSLSFELPAMHDIDKIIFEKVRQSDENAFEILFKNYYQALCLYANRYLNDLVASEEIVSEIFTFIWDQRENMVISTSFKSYIFMAVQNRCLNYLKHKKIESRYLDYLNRKNLVDDAAFQNSIIDSYSNKELSIEIEKAIEGLPEKCREIFTLSRFHQLTYKQIAEKLSVSPKTVENQIGIALAKLRIRLREFLTFLF